MKQQWSKMLMVLVFTLFLFGPCLAGISPTAVNDAAREGLGQFQEMGTITAQNARLGFGFQVHTVSPETLLNRTDLTLEAIVLPTDTWRFLVFENDSPIGLLTVARVNDQWQAVSFGGTGLAAEVREVSAAWPADKGYSFRFIRIYQAQSDFMEILKGTDTKGFAPLAAARVSLGLDSFGLASGALVHNSEILRPLREMVSRNASLSSEMNRD